MAVRLAYLLSQYPAVNHIFMLREVRSLRGLGLEVQVISIRDPDRDSAGMTTVEQEEAQTTYYVKSAGWTHIISAHLRTLFTRPAAYLRALFRAVPKDMFYFAEAVVVGDWMRAHRLAHVHTHYASTVGLIVKRIFPVTLSATFHGPDEFQDPVGTRLAEKVEASLFACAISQYGAAQLMSACGYEQWPKVEITLLGIDPGELPPRPFRPNPSPFEIVCVGRLAPVKGQHLLIAAVGLLVNEGRQIRLRLVGDGPDRTELQHDADRRGLSAQVSFEGNVNQERLREIYCQSDALVLASFAEGLPVVLMEAMAMEIPCIAPWINGIPEIITHEADGLLVPPGDAEALARAIATLIDDASLRYTLGQNARRKVQEKFNLQTNVEHLAAIFRGAGS